MTILRSPLFVPGNKANMLEKALALQPDAFVPDMEDSVPAAEKANARETIRSFLPRLAASGRPVIPRVNALDTEWIEADLAAVVGRTSSASPSAKCATPATSRDLAAHRRARAPRRLRVGTLHLLPWIETAEAIVNVGGDLPRQRAHRRRRVRRRGLHERHGHRAPRGRVADRVRAPSVVRRGTRRARARARHAVLQAAQSRRAARQRAQAKSIGFKGKFAIHPEQIDTLNDCFSPSAQEIAHAERVVAAFEEAERARPRLDVARRLGHRRARRQARPRAARARAPRARRALTARRH